MRAALAVAVLAWLCVLSACSRAVAPPLTSQPVAHRIVSLAPGVTELVYAAGAGQSLVAVGAYSDYPSQATLLPQVGDAFRVDLERLLALRPDLVLAWNSGTSPDVIAQMRKLGLHVESFELQRIDDVSATLRRIGELTDTASSAQRAAAQFDADIARLRERYAGRPPLDVFIEINRRPLYTVSKQQLISEVVALCGGRNVFADIGQLAPEVGVEAVLKAAPQVILSTEGSAAELQQDWRAWPQLAAVQHRHVYAVSRDTVGRAGPRLVQGVQEVCETLDKARAVGATSD